MLTSCPWQAIVQSLGNIYTEMTALVKKWGA